MPDRFDEIEHKIRAIYFDKHDFTYGNVAAYLRAEFGKEWIPVSERLPEDGHICVIHYESDGRPMGYGLDHYHELDNCKGAFRWSHDMSTQPIKVTHWMPLPEPPKESKQNE